MINGTTDISSIKHVNSKTKHSEELAGPYLTVEKPNVNMEEEAVEFASIIEQKNRAAAAALAEISTTVVKITEDLRRQNGIFYPADKQ